VEECMANKKETKVDLSSLTVAELKEMAKKAKIDGYTTMKKQELIDVLKKINRLMN